ncbi:MAG: hypothetical protein ABI184_06595 [Ginsengibacter sp.]
MPGSQRKDQNKKAEKKTTITEDLFDALNPNNMLNNAQRVLSSAVNVLEEEIAAGILAAKKIERKVLNVDDVRNSPENLLNRIRKDTHEVVDLFLDAAIALSSQLKVLSDNVTTQTENIKKNETSPEKKQRDAITVVQNDEPLKPGATAILYINLSDEDATAPVKIQLQKNDLVGALKEKIAAGNITIKPSSVILKPGENKEVTITIKVPVKCKQGYYTALFTDIQNPLLKVIVSIEVI